MTKDAAPSAAREDVVQAWFAGRIPDGWYEGGPQVEVDREEVVVTGLIADPAIDADADDDARRAARIARVKRFREETREARIRIASEAEHLFGRKVSWGAGTGDEQWLFTNVAVPVMTRLRMSERRVLDTLIDGGVARSRSEALAWCVRLVGQHQGEWIDQLREALRAVDRVRAEGPASG